MHDLNKFLFSFILLLLFHTFAYHNPVVSFWASSSIHVDMKLNQWFKHSSQLSHSYSNSRVQSQHYNEQSGFINSLDAHILEFCLRLFEGLFHDIFKFISVANVFQWFRVRCHETAEAVAVACLKPCRWINVIVGLLKSSVRNHPVPLNCALPQEIC